MRTHKKSQTMVKSMMILLVLGLLVRGNVADLLKKKPNISTQGSKYQARQCRGRTASLTDFGGKGDGTTLNTAAFKKAVANLTNVPGGAQLLVPAGKWLTGSFNLTSHFTLYIHKDAVILASQDESDYPLVKALPSYGVGRDGANLLRFPSLITGTNLTDVVITGGNGTIDGQGKVWWDKFHNNLLKYTRPYLIEILFSNQVQISNLTLVNSPSWHVHPIYCDEVIIEYLTINAPVYVPNTDGINPDSCTNTRIRDSYVVSGDDCIAVKSGWDEYGTRVHRPTQNLSIARFTCISPKSAVIALGSEMSGGIENVRAQDIYALNSESGIRVKTAVGRGAYVKDLFVKNMIVDTIYKYLIWTAGNYGSHPDGGFDPNALPNITNLNFRDMVAKNVTAVGSLSGIHGDPFTGICISNVTAQLTKNPKLAWNCTDIQGVWDNVTPMPCGSLKEVKNGCDFPDDTLAIDEVVLKDCPIVGA